ncbi:hypothetical protein PABG_11779 [Paracoccidioides brasiliensis Pb03]|nr:hypothetical protein PABG_11779 [Paracoccidioides brasiliensis Pb03]
MGRGEVGPQSIDGGSRAPQFPHTQGLRKAVTDSVVRHVWDSMSQELHDREGSAQVQAELL